MRCSRERTNREGSKSWDSWCCPDIFFWWYIWGTSFLIFLPRCLWCTAPPPPNPLSTALTSFHPPLLDSHQAAFALQSLCAGLLSGTFTVNVEAHVPLLVQVEELLEELGDVVIGFGWCLHKGALPLVGLSLPVLGLHLSLGLVTLVSHKHYRNRLNVAFYGQNLQRKAEKADHLCFLKGHVF